MTPELFNWIVSGLCSFFGTHIMSVFHSFSLPLAIVYAQCLDLLIHWRLEGGNILSFCSHLFTGIILLKGTPHLLLFGW